MTRNEARQIAVRQAEFYEREAAILRTGRNRERYLTLAKALRVLIAASPL